MDSCSWVTDAGGRSGRSEGLRGAEASFYGELGLVYGYYKPLG